MIYIRKTSDNTSWSVKRKTDIKSIKKRLTLDMQENNEHYQNLRCCQGEGKKTVIVKDNAPGFTTGSYYIIYGMTKNAVQDIIDDVLEDTTGRSKYAARYHRCVWCEVHDYNDCRNREECTTYKEM